MKTFGSAFFLLIWQRLRRQIWIGWSSKNVNVQKHASHPKQSTFVLPISGPCPSGEPIGKIFTWQFVRGEFQCETLAWVSELAFEGEQGAKNGSKKTKSESAAGTMNSVCRSYFACNVRESEVDRSRARDFRSTFLEQVLSSFPAT